MEKLKSLFEKHRELITYVFFGGLTTLVYFAVRYSLYFLRMDINPASVISWTCAVTFAFFVNKIFVFRNKSEKVSGWFVQALGFYGARLITLGFELAFMNVTVHVFKWSEFWMIMAMQVFILAGNYLISKFFIFKKKPPV